MEQEIQQALQTLLEKDATSTHDLITSLEHILVQQYQKLASQQQPLTSDSSSSSLSKDNFKTSLQNALQNNSIAHFSISWIDSQFNHFILQNSFSNKSITYFATTQYRILDSLSQKYQISVPQQWFH